MECAETPTNAPAPTIRSRVLHGKLLLAHVNAVGLRQGRQVGPIVDDQQRRRPAGQLPQPAGTVDQLAVGQPLVAQLEDVRAGLHEPLSQPLEFLDIRSPVEQDVKPGRRQSLQSDPRRAGLAPAACTLDSESARLLPPWQGQVFFQILRGFAGFLQAGGSWRSERQRDSPGYAPKGW